nr:hypothetical protein GCM10010200_030360 [Actinomadura rugatobispora]
MHNNTEQNHERHGHRHSHTKNDRQYLIPVNREVIHHSYREDNGTDRPQNQNEPCNPCTDPRPCGQFNPPAPQDHTT